MPLKNSNKTLKSTQNELTKALLLLSLTRTITEIREGQIQLDDRENYKTLTTLTPMVVETHKKVNQLISKLYQENVIDKKTEKWLSLTLVPPRIPEFYTPTKIHKPNQ